MNLQVRCLAELVCSLACFCLAYGAMVERVPELMYFGWIVGSGFLLMALATAWNDVNP